MGINFNKAEFILSAVKQSAFIRDGRPQVALLVSVSFVSLLLLAAKLWEWLLSMA